jgi:hypothetical protein
MAQFDGNWVTMGPPGGTVLALLKSPRASTMLYAGTAANGVFMSADTGLTWAAANTGLPVTPDTASRTVHALVADTQYLYAATDAGLFYAAAGAVAGEMPSWSPLTTPGPVGSMTPIALLLVDVPSGSLFAAATTATPGAAPVVYRMALPAPVAQPSGAWIASPLPAEVVGAGIGSMTVVPGDGLLVSALDRVYSATNPGGTLPLSWIDADPSHNLLGQGAVEVLHYSADFGQTYACSGSQMFVRAPLLNAWAASLLPNAGPVAIMCGAMASGGSPSVPPLVALATNVGIYFSQDGTTFSAAKTPAVSPSANAVMISSDMVPALYVGAGFGVLSQPLPSIMSTSSWTANNGPAAAPPVSGPNGRLNNANVIDISVMGTTLYAAVSSEQYADVLVSNDGGANWTSTGLSQRAGGPMEITALASDSTNHVAYAGTGTGLFALTAGGWNPVLAAASADLGFVRSLARDGSRLYIGTDAGAYSLALGASPATTVAARAGLDALRISALLVSGGKVYAGTQDLNTGSASVSAAPSVAAGSPAWTDFASGSVGTHRINSLALAGTTLLAGTRGELVSAAAPGGAWGDASNGLRDPLNPSDPNRVVTALYSDGTTVFAATNSSGIYSTPVGNGVGAGSMWAPFNGGGDQALPAFGVNQLRSDGSLLYAATAGGLARFDGVVPVVMPPPAPDTTPPDAGQGGGGGGGAFDLWSLLGLALLVCLLAAVGNANRKAD